jgi:hypothetical protein
VEFLEPVSEDFLAHSQGVADSDKLGKGKAVSQPTLQSDYFTYRKTSLTAEFSARHAAFLATLFNGDAERS